jgi:hypothetical protein
VAPAQFRKVPAPLLLHIVTSSRRGRPHVVLPTKASVCLVFELVIGYFSPHSRHQKISVTRSFTLVRLVLASLAFSDDFEKFHMLVVIGLDTQMD